MTTLVDAERTIDFRVPPGAEATAPPERRGLARDEVRMRVNSPARSHTRVSAPARPPHSGDLVAVNTTRTLAAALQVWRDEPRDALMHVAGELDDGSWLIEVRRRR